MINHGKKILVLVLALWISGSLCVQAEESEEVTELKGIISCEEPFLFENGDVVGFIGDSITHADYTAINYVEFIQNYYVTRFPQKEIEFRNLGVSSYTAGDILNLVYDQDEAYRGITKAVIMLGMNEGLQGVSTETYLTNITGIVNKLKEDGLENQDIILVSPSAYDEKCSYNLDKNGNLIRETDSRYLVYYTTELEKLASELGTHYIDLHTPTNWIAGLAQEEDPFNTLTVTDCVHPNGMGQIAMAYFFLLQQGADEVVSTVYLGEDGETEAGNANVKDLIRREDAIRYTYEPLSLPVAMTYDLEQFSQFFSLADAISREIIQVKGLVPDAVYVMAMDQTTIGTYTGEQLAAGINVASCENNPNQILAKEIEALNQSWHIASYTYRGMVHYSTMDKPTNSAEERQSAYEIWAASTSELKDQMQEKAQQAAGSSYMVTITKEGCEAISADEKASGSAENAPKKAEVATVSKTVNRNGMLVRFCVITAAVLITLIGFLIRRKKSRCSK